MASKKFKLLLGLISLFSSATFAQSDAGYDWRDSSKIPTKLLPQHSEFLNNQYPYPARPRDQWELGISGGFSFIVGDVSPRPGFGGGLSVRKSLSHTFSLRGSYIGSFNYGLDYRTTIPNQLPGNNINDPYRAIYLPGNRQFVAAYRNATHQAAVELVSSFLNTSHYRGNPKNDFYAFIGYSALFMDVDVDALNSNGAPYNITPATFNFDRPRKDIRKALKNAMDLKYENNGGALNGNRANAGRVNDNQLIRHAFTTGLGFAHKLNDKINIGLEQRFTYGFDDNMDAINKGKSNDLLSFTSLRLNINMGNKAKHVQPLWWIIPNNFIYNELNAPQHMKLPKPILPDADGDGVTDQFDLDPNTPAGVAVDVRGAPRDTDMDGVPDYKDKELLTPNKCLPVDADGVGNCPEPACCKELKDAMANMKSGMGAAGDCAVGNLPSVQFKAGSATLSKDAQAVLAGAASQIKANPTCKIKVTGYGASDKRAQQLSWDRVNSVIRYLVERQGIAEDRFIFSYGTEGDVNTVDLMGTTEEGPNTVPAPHPNLKKG